MAAAYKENEDGEGELFEITEDAEWKLIEEVLADFENEDCDCDCDECEEECDCKDEECKCHHHE